MASFKDLSDFDSQMQGIQAGIERMTRSLDFTNFKAPNMKPRAVVEADTFQDAIKETIEAFEKDLGRDEELLIYCSSGLECIRVTTIVMPSINLVVLIGADLEGNDCRVLAHVQSVQFVCKVIKLKPEEKPKRIGFISPEAA